MVDLTESPPKEVKPANLEFKTNEGLINSENMVDLTESSPKKVKPTNIEPELQWLKEHLCPDKVQVNKLLTKQPSIFNCSIPDNLKPKI